MPPPEAVKVPEGAAQVSVNVAGKIAAVGAVISWFTTRETEAVQPFAGFVTVTVKVPGALAVIAAVAAPVLHA